jgi:gliding motility-associated-like protein
VYVITVSDQNGCTFVQDFTVIEPPLVTLDLGPNQTVQAQDTIKLGLETNIPAGALADINWGGYDGIFCPGCPVFEFIATSSATITAIVQDTSGCLAIDSMRLTVIVPRIIYIPNVFSPNGDGINDFFTIHGRFNLTNIASMQIFDRWGNQLFENKDMTPGDESLGWDGTFDKEPVQSGVYVYVAELVYEDGYSETVAGSITIVR